MARTKSKSGLDGTCCHSFSSPAVVARYSKGVKACRPLSVNCFAMDNALLSGQRRTYQGSMRFDERLAIRDERNRFLVNN